MLPDAEIAKDMDGSIRETQSRLLPCKCVIFPSAALRDMEKKDKKQRA